MENLMRKFLNGTDLSEHELRELQDWAIDDIEKGESRWSMRTQSIIIFEDKYYAIDWDRGLTECQENYFGNQPYEVKRVETPIIKVTYEKIKKLTKGRK